MGFVQSTQRAYTTLGLPHVHTHWEIWWTWWPS